MKSTARELALAYLEEVLAAEGEVLNMADSLSPEDRALFQEISQGVLREWLFLEWVVGGLAKKPPKGALKPILALSAYQILFLDRVPEYAIFSEAKKLGEKARLAEAELSFLHGVLKSVARDKQDLLRQRTEALDRAQKGEAPKANLDWAALNAPKPLFDVLAWKKKAFATRALAAMKNRARLVGYSLRGIDGAEAYSSAIAPRALLLSAEQVRQNDRFRVQGEASQWACEIAADALAKLAAGSKKMRVLEMAAGRGGKLLGTLSALTAKHPGARSWSLEWTASDVSQAQLDLLESSAKDLLKEEWPNLKLTVLRSDWLRAEAKSEYDFVWLDAPCTGFGTLAKLPQIALTRGPTAGEQALVMGKIQKALCAKGLKLLAKNAAFFYTVCTLTLAETGEITDFCVQSLGRKPSFAQWLWPGQPPAPEAEGFYASLFIPDQLGT